MKKTIIIDVDSTLGNSTETIFNICKEEMNLKGEYHLNYLWNFKGLLPSECVGRAVELFGEKKFFDRLQPFPDAYRVVKKLNSKYDIKICSIHKADTAHRKVRWIREQFPFIEEKNIIIIPYEQGFDKSKVEGDIIIDDKFSCIQGDRKLKILFGNYGYNQYENLTKEEKIIYSISNNILRAENWKVVESILL